MKKVFNVIIFLSIFSVLLSGCFFYKDNKKFSEIKTGDTFLISGDGYYEKLPNNYCFYVMLGSKTYLFRVPDEFVDVKCTDYDWGNWWYNGGTILEGHFIKSFYTSGYLVLCEEKENDDLVYLTFDFSNAQVQYHLDVNEVCELLNINSIQWSVLCNTNEEIRRKN